MRKLRLLGERESARRLRAPGESFPLRRIDEGGDVEGKLGLAMGLLLSSLVFIGMTPLPGQEEA